MFISESKKNEHSLMYFNLKILFSEIVYVLIYRMVYVSFQQELI